MTNSPDSRNQPTPPPPPRHWRWWQIGLVLGGLGLVGVGAGGWWVWRFIHTDLPPLVSDSLSEQLNRPVEVGSVEAVSFSHLRIGESALPATETDADRATVEAIEVRFNLLDVLFSRTLNLDVTLIRPTAFIDQNQDGLWITTTLKQEEEETENWVEIKLDTIRIRDGVVDLAPYIQADIQADTQAEGVTDSEPPEEPDTPTDAPVVPSDPAEAARSEATTAPAAPNLPQPIVTLQAVNGAAQFRNDNQLITFNVATQPEDGGRLQVRGRVDLEQPETTLSVEGNNLFAQDMSLLLPLPISLEAGLLNPNLEVTFPPNNQPLALDGTVRFRDLTAQIPGAPQPLTNLQGGLRFQGQTIRFQEVTGQYGAIPAVVTGSLDTQTGYDLRVRVPEVTIADLLQSLTVEESSLPIALAGALTSEIQVGGAIDRPQVQGVVENTELVQVDQIELADLRTEFSLTPDALVFEQIEASPTAGGQLTGQGRVALSETGGLVFDIAANSLPGDAIASAYGANLEAVTIGAVDATAQVFGSFDNIQAIVQWQAPQATYPGRGQVTIAGDTIRFQDTALLVANGLVQGEGQISQGQFQATLRGSGVELSQFSPELRGVFSGDIRLAGQLDNLDPSAIQAEGDVAFSEGIALITTPLQASVRWLGDGIEILEATADGLRADGVIGVTLQDAPGISNLDLNVQLQDYAIAALPIPIPAAIQVAGTTDFSGRVTGSPTAPSVTGQVALNDLQVNQLAFEPVLSGDIDYTNQGLNLDVAGVQDEIVVQLDASNRPTYFRVQQDTAIAEGQGEGDRLRATLRNFPLEVLGIEPVVGLGSVAGLANANVNIDLADLSSPDVIGAVAIANPALGYISADSLQAQFRYIDGVGVLESGELRRANSRYLLSGSYNPSTDPQFQGQIIAAEGRVEDILAALRWFELSDLSRGIAPPTYGEAADVETIAVGLPNASLFEQVLRFSELTALRDLQVAQREASELLPALSSLQGGFTGEVNLAYSAQAGPTLDFNLTGQDWQWGKYDVNQVIAQGGFQDGILTLRPLQFQSDQSFLKFTGQVGGEQQSGQLLAENVPIEAIQQLLRLPLDVQGGDLDANAFLTGSITNPQLIGEVVLSDLTLNGVEAPTFRTLFGYNSSNNARLKVESRVVDDEADTFQFTADIPYVLPFMTRPENYSTDFAVELDVRNEGLALVSLFTDQVAWKGGEGQVELIAQGTFDSTGEEPTVDLTATGTATFQEAVIGAQALPEDLTNVNGTVLFQNDRIRVDDASGQFSDGQVTASGTLPLVVPLNLNNPNEDQPLNINLNGLNLSLENLYDGEVEGLVVIEGTALAPVIGGELTLQNGRAFIPDAAPEGTTVVAPAETEPSIFLPPELQDLRITLGDRLYIVKDPLLRFLVAGDLLVNGTQDDLRPEGTIRIRSGQVNLFTTQFVLARGYENTATFTAARGTDPILDVRLVASIPEVTRAPNITASPLTGSDIADTPDFEYGSVQTVRVQAEVMGPASQIYNNLELTSTPSRSESEIVALLGGGFVSTLSGGTAAIANLAGATLLSGLQSLITNTTGLSDFRLFPTSVISEDERSTTLALAAELGVDITDDLSVSVLQLLTVEEPARFNVRYRLNDEFSVRGSTNFENDSRAVLEFETRF